MQSVLTDPTEAYIQGMQPAVDPQLEEIEDYARENDVPIAARDVARFQTMLVQATGADRVLEIGTAIGYTTIQLARAGASVVTIELDPDRIETARRFIEQADVASSIEIKQGDAKEVLPDLDEKFDLTFIDGPVQDYTTYFKHSLPLLQHGGVFVIDNLLRKGRVPVAEAEETAPGADATSLLSFNEAFMNHDQLNSVILPLDDGTGFAIKQA